jgi:uncharacterized protein
VAPQEPALDTETPLSDADIDRLQALLAALPPPLEPPDLSALDGWLCGVLLQPQPVPPARWLGFAHDVEGRAAPLGLALDELQALVRRRHAELDRTIAARQWFDPWVAPPDDEDAPPAESVLPWVAGFAAAMDAFPTLTALDEPALVEPLALLYLHFDPDDLEDADALAAVIGTLEPPADLTEAVQDLVRAVMLIADVSRPRTAAAVRPVPSRRPAGARAKRPGNPRR